jgi:hypothetical protein
MDDVPPLLAPEPVSALAVPALINAAPDVLARASAAIVAILPKFVFFIFILDLNIFFLRGLWGKDAWSLFSVVLVLNG